MREPATIGSLTRQTVSTLGNQQQESPSDLEKRFIAAASKFCINGPFEIDTDNRYAVEQILLYMAKDPSFFGNLDKGICLAGKKGTGKSVMLKALQLITPERFGIDNIVSFAGYYQQKDVGESAFEVVTKRTIRGGGEHSGPMPNHRMCNDLGREQEKVQHMGNCEDVGARYIYERYELFQQHRIKTHVTTNFMTDVEFINRYGDLNYDRIKEMCNFIFLTGPSKRK